MICEPVADRAATGVKTAHAIKSAPAVSMRDTVRHGLAGRGGVALARAVRSGSVSTPAPATPFMGLVAGPIRD
jgi:hypothetical protein